MTEVAQFLWGAPKTVRERVRADVPQFRLVNHAAGDALAPVVQSFAVEQAENVRTLRDAAGRAVGTRWEDADASYCFLAGVDAPDLSAPRPAQAAAVFPELARLLESAGFTFSNVVRTWLYIDSVCEWYADFNAARSAYFTAHNVFDTFLPASTGIGSANLEGAALTAGAIAMKPKREGVRAEIVTSPLQAPAMAYKSSFSRAAEIVKPSGGRLFVSGTASLRPNSHEVAYVGDAERQVICTMNAVGAILESRGRSWRNVSRAIVYLKRPEFRAAWRQWLEAHDLPADFAVETVCDVCRDEWLFEIECDAV